MYQMIWTVVLKLGMWYLDFRQAKAENKKEFMKWVAAHNQKALRSAEIHTEWNDILAAMKKDSEPK